MWGVAHHRDDLLLCVSELAGNALRHGVPPGRYYRVRLRRYEGGVRLEVHDSGPGLSRTRIGDGYGLRIVEALSDRWGAVPRQPGKSVWCEFGAPSKVSPPPAWQFLMEPIADPAAGRGHARERLE
ncbi:ATP-binding protein [Streptomyces globosus]|uniref:ATP-binding protein n=1 Tax=Streptomyces sp. WAC05292 TaxID=2487418 RepID=UPI002686B461